MHQLIVLLLLITSIVDIHGMEQSLGFKYDTEIVTAREGEPFKLECSTADNMSKRKLFWIQKTSEGHLKTISSSRLTNVPNGTLWFSSVRMEDATTSDFVYACAEHTTLGAYQVTKSVYLEVTPSSKVQLEEAPTLLYASPMTEVAFQGQSVSLWCIVGGNPLPEIKWSKDGLQPQGTHKAQYEEFKKKFTLKYLNPTDQGIYVCEASNGVGKPLRHSIKLAVKATNDLYLTRDIETLKSVFEGATVKFECEVSGSPVPSIEWIYNNGSGITSKARADIEGNNLIIKNVSPTDVGNYTCKASNVYGFTYINFQLYVLKRSKTTQKPAMQIVNPRETTGSSSNPTFSKTAEYGIGNISTILKFNHPFINILGIVATLYCVLF